LSHTDAKLLCNVKCEEGEEQRAANAIDETDHNHNPEQAGKLTVDLIDSS
jgi:hypothetical protein